jgi:uncharacterized protein (DUF1015 family)
LAGPKADRLELLKAVRAHFGQIFVLYSDPSGAIDMDLASRPQDSPWQTIQDEYGTCHTVRRISDPLLIEKVVMSMQDKKLVIADGHHRYETALAYRDYCRAQSLPDDRPEYVMMTFVRMESESLTILPTHRVVHSLPRFDWQEFITSAQGFFTAEEFRVQGPVEDWKGRFLDALAQAGRERPSIGVYAGRGKLAILGLREDADLEDALADVPPTLRHLGVIILHRLLIERVLGIDRQAVREERNLRYAREFGDAVREIESKKAQISFLMNPTPIRDVWNNALAGHFLPQKSTDFYPKLLSGLTIYWLDNPAGM